MRYLPFILSSLVTLMLVVVLSNRWGSVPAMGTFLSPQHGCWQNADPAAENFSIELDDPFLQDAVSVYLDENLIPHVFAKNESDLYFVQGYLHARFRLWQMEFQTHAAAGRLCEVLGEKIGDINLLDRADRQFRRLGMQYAAEKSLVEAENDPVTKTELDGYTAGVNAYINQLNDSELPIEYKLLGYKPEPWSNLKCMLFLKYMSYDLAGFETDFEMTAARQIFNDSDFNKLYPISQDSLSPIVPKGTAFAAGIPLTIPATADSNYFPKQIGDILSPKPDPDNGSNNWAVDGSKTASGAPILCNDPHLALNLPSLWYEIQLSTPEFNAYGASFPGAPSVIIGFNDSCAWGFTNAMRDVRDYYEIKFRDSSMSEYWFDSAWHPTTFRYETIKIKGKPDFVDTVAYTNWGPVMYDRHYNGGRSTAGKYFAVRWKAHDPSNELKVFNRLNHAKNYDDYLAAIQDMQTPGQNCIFASKSGRVAIWDQGNFPAKWYRQGDFVMPGEDSSYAWQAEIPSDQNPHVVDPVNGYVSSANQLPADLAVYPYYLGGTFPPYRGFIINRYLDSMQQITLADMKKMQTDNYNVFAEMARPLLLKYIRESSLTTEERGYLNAMRSWDLRNDVNEKGPAIFTNTWDSLEANIWSDELMRSRTKLEWPHESTLLEALLRDSSFSFIDNINTAETETLYDEMTSAFRKAVKVCADADYRNQLGWASFKNTGVNHLLKLPAFSRLHLPIGGGLHVINATKPLHGPSWRMIVELTDSTKAVGIYPGGQNGNPGSAYYDSFVDRWAAGEYHDIWVMRAEDTNNVRIRWVMQFGQQTAASSK